MSKNWNPDAVQKINKIPWNELTTLSDNDNIL